MLKFYLINEIRFNNNVNLKNHKYFINYGIIHLNKFPIKIL